MEHSDPFDLVAVYIGFYQDAIAMKRCLDNLYAIGFKHVLCYDGRAEKFEGVGNVSTDGSHELVKSYSNTELYYFPDRPHIEIKEKINMACQRAGQLGCEWIIIMGCDEWLEGDPIVAIAMAAMQREFNPEYHLFNIKFVEHNMLTVHARDIKYLPRIIHDPVNITTKHTHWLRFHKGIRQDAKVNIDILQLHHDDSIRPAWRNKLMDEYQAKNVPVEHKQLLEVLHYTAKDLKETYVQADCPKCGILKAFVMGRCVGCNQPYPSNVF